MLEISFADETNTGALKLSNRYTTIYNTLTAMGNLTNNSRLSSKIKQIK